MKRLPNVRVLVAAPHHTPERAHVAAVGRACVVHAGVEVALIVGGGGCHEKSYGGGGSGGQGVGRYECGEADMTTPLIAMTAWFGIRQPGSGTSQIAFS